jgi:hypothetical protein
VSGAITRPTFYEGEVLPAADLGAAVEYPRNQMARHARHAHSWGIVTGLQLTSTPMATAGGLAYVKVTVSPGLAIDGTGREIVVPAALDLDPGVFLTSVNPQADPTLLYPVFLSGLDQPAPPSSNLTGLCVSAQPTRMQENYAVQFGAPGSELSLADQSAPGITDAPDDGVSSAWNTLLGFVTWSIPASSFSGTAGTNPASNVGRRYIGATAAQVASGSGSLLLATHPVSFKGPNAIMAVQITEDPTTGRLVFGKLNADGTIVPALTVSANGDVTATGQVKGAVTPGSMQVQSGVAFDGMILPLPLGIDPADVAAGKVTLHTHVSLRMDQPQLPTLYALPYECYVEAGTRQVHCRIQQWDLTVPSAVAIVASNCDYTVIAAVAAS